MRKAAKSKKFLQTENIVDFYIPQTHQEPKPLKALTINQEKYIKAIKSSTITFGLGTAGGGKAQPLHALVLTPDGFVPMGDIHVGDKVANELGEFSTVLAEFPQKNLNMYRVTFSDDSVVECCEDHLWEIQTSKLRHNGRYSVRTLKELMLKPLRKNPNKSKVLNGYRYTVRLTKPVNFSEKPLKISPYSLGYILGNGHRTLNERYSQLTVTCGFEDAEEVRSYFNSSEVGELRKRQVNVICFGINPEYAKYYDELEGLNVKAGIKFIPEIYLQGSIEQRKDLLAGLLDSDGSCTNNRASFSSTSLKLSEGVVNLVRSLGGRARLHTFDRDEKGIEYSVQIRTPFNPFKLKRKAEKYTVTSKDTRNFKGIASVEPIGGMDGKCIYLDNPTHLYITNDYTVTHNTYIAGAMAADYMKNGDFDSIVLIRPALTAGESLGFTPGSIDEKYSLFLEPIIDVLHERLGKSQTDYYVKQGRISGKPLAYLRGKSFKDCFIILDEAQNVSPQQMYMLLTRIGENCKLVVCGDEIQKDLKGKSGLQDALDKLYGKLDNCRFVFFTIDDVVRSGIVKDIIQLYNNP